MNKKIAIVGAGKIAGYHVRELERRGDVLVVAVVDPVRGNREKLIEGSKLLTEHPPAQLGDISDLFTGHIECDGAIVATPHASHASIAERVIDAGMHAYVEKPFTLDVADARRLVARAHEKRVILEVGENRVVFPEYLAAVRAAQAGKVGAIEGFLFYTKFPWEKNSRGTWRLDPDEAGAGILTDHSPHYSHLLFGVLGFKIKEINHRESTIGPKGVDIAVQYEMYDHDGRVAFIWIDGTETTNKGIELVRMYGTQGFITVKHEYGSRGFSSIRREGDVEKDLPLEGAIDYLRGLGITDPTSKPLLIHNFLAMLEGNKLNACSGYSAILPVATTAAIHQSRDNYRAISAGRYPLRLAEDLANLNNRGNFV